MKEKSLPQKDENMIWDYFSRRHLYQKLEIYIFFSKLKVRVFYKTFWSRPWMFDEFFFFCGQLKGKIKDKQDPVIFSSSRFLPQAVSFIKKLKNYEWWWVFQSYSKIVLRVDKCF